MATEYTAKRPRFPLRRRMHILERASTTLKNGVSSDPKDVPFSQNPHVDDEKAEENDHSPIEYDSESDSSENFAQGASEVASSPSTTNKTRTSHSPPPPIDMSYSYPASKSPKSSPTRAWYEFDLAVVVALVSPLANWFTGGDHIKNFFLLLLLIFYLHQIIEIPWTLYNNARPRRRAPHIPGSTSEERYQNLASSELKVLEFCFLALTLVSPFLGAAILRYVIHSVAGADVITWFSTALFILATGIRPWKHIIERLSQRTEDLHDVVHYPSTSNFSEDLQKKMEETMHRVAHLEKALVKMRSKLSENADEVYEYVDDALDAVDNTMKRHERKCEKYEVKVKTIEESVESLKKGKEKAIFVDTRLAASASSSIFAYLLPEWLLLPPRRNQSSPTHSPPISGSKHSMRGFPSSSQIRLATIPEEGTSLINTRFVPSSPPLASPYPGASFLTRCAAFITFPLRTIIGLFAKSYYHETR